MREHRALSREQRGRVRVCPGTPSHPARLQHCWIRSCLFTEKTHESNLPQLTPRAAAVGKAGFEVWVLTMQTGTMMVCHHTGLTISGLTNL